jgi:hypothetical protein
MASGNARTLAALPAELTIGAPPGGSTATQALA